MNTALVAPSPTHSLLYHPKLHAVVLRWLVFPCTLPEVRASFKAALALARRENCARWIIDTRHARPVDLELMHWLTREFFPLAAARLAPQLLRLAVISDATRLAQFRVDAVLAHAVADALVAAHPYQARVFADEGTAVAWLLAQPA